MENTRLFSEFNDYNLKINLDFIEYLRGLEVKNERVMLLMSHIINAHQIWNERISGVANTVAVFELRGLDELLEQSKQNHAQTAEILRSEDLTRTLIYTNTKGQKFQNQIFQILLHTFNHHSYHRGQINQLLVQEGHKALITDYIFHNRAEL